MRSFCPKCISYERQTGNIRGNCCFCEGVCDCNRCQSMDNLTKMMALYSDFGGNIYQLSEHFHMKINSDQVLEFRNCDEIKRRQDKGKEMDDYIEEFFDQGIFHLKKDFPVSYPFKPIIYFHSKILESHESKLLYSRYHFRELNIGESS